jgi:hypothetical protein
MSKKQQINEALAMQDASNAPPVACPLLSSNLLIFSLADGISSGIAHGYQPLLL